MQRLLDHTKSLISSVDWFSSPMPAFNREIICVSFKAVLCCSFDNINSVVIPFWSPYTIKQDQTTCKVTHHSHTIIPLSSFWFLALTLYVLQNLAKQHAWSILSARSSGFHISVSLPLHISRLNSFSYLLMFNSWWFNMNSNYWANTRNCHQSIRWCCPTLLSCNFSIIQNQNFYSSHVQLWSSSMGKTYSQILILLLPVCKVLFIFILWAFPDQIQFPIWNADEYCLMEQYR